LLANDLVLAQKGVGAVHGVKTGSALVEHKIFIEAAYVEPRFTISLKRSTQILQLSTSW